MFRSAGAEPPPRQRLPGLMWLQCGMIRRPMSIWHGVQDANLAPADGVWLSQHVPGARLHSLEDTDYISIILRIDSILDELNRLAQLQHRPASASVTA